MYGVVGLVPRNRQKPHKQTTPSPQSTQLPDGVPPAATTFATATTDATAATVATVTPLSSHFDQFIQTAMSEASSRVVQTEGVSGLDWSPTGEIAVTYRYALYAYIHACMYVW